METMRKRIKDDNLPRISMEGFQKPVSYYKKASIFVMTSAFEGFPNVLLEAQSYGCASVLFNSYLALGSIVKDRTNAFLIPPFNVEEMSLSVNKLGGNQKLLNEVQKAALQNAKRFTIEKVGKQWEEFFAKTQEINVHQV